MANFTQAHVFNSSFTQVQAAFQSYCKNVAGFAAADCDTVVSPTKGATLNQLKRAGYLCNQLAQCATGDSPAYNPLCTFATSPRLVADIPTNTSSTDGKVNMCTVEGTNNGADIPGTSSVANPDKTCTTTTATTDCAATERCNVDNPRPFVRCSPSSGQEVTLQLGLCVLKPEVACGKCLDDFNAWATAAGTQSASVDSLVSGFSAKCAELNRTKAACDAATNAVQASFKGNQGRRAGAICRLLGECRPADLVSTAVQVNVPTPATGAFSSCKQTGLVGGAIVTNYPTSLAALSGIQCR